MKRQLLGLFAAFCGLSLATEAQIFLNEINLVTGPNAGQFVELHGPANQSVDGHALVVVKSSFSGGDWTATVQDVVDLQGQSLDGEGFLLLEGEGWQNTVAGVVLTAQPASEFELNASPTFTGMADAVLYGNTSVTNPSLSPTSTSRRSYTFSANWTSTYGWRPSYWIKRSLKANTSFRSSKTTSAVAE